jgi:hypothetical protein
MRTSPACVALGLAASCHLAAAAPVPLAAVSEWAQQIRHSIQGIMSHGSKPVPVVVVVDSSRISSEAPDPASLPPPPAPPSASSNRDGDLTIDAANAYEQPAFVIDNRPITPSATVPPQVALDAPVPLHTAYLWMLSKHPRLLAGLQEGGELPGPDEAGIEGDQSEDVPDTVSPTSYARIEAGLIELYPSRPGMPCWHRAVRGRMAHHQHGMVVVGFVVSFLIVLLLLETGAAATRRWVPSRPCRFQRLLANPVSRLRQLLRREGAIRLEDEVESGTTSFRGDASLEDATKEAPSAENSISEKINC